MITRGLEARLLAACGALFALAFASTARADDSQIKISEVYTDACNIAAR